jgi:hypothetical protein
MKPITMPDNKNTTKKILDKIALMEAFAESILTECRAVRKLLESETSSDSDNMPLSPIAMQARMDLRAKILKATKTGKKK